MGDGCYYGGKYSVYGDILVFGYWGMSSFQCIGLIVFVYEKIKYSIFVGVCELKFCKNV